MTTASQARADVAPAPGPRRGPWQAEHLPFLVLLAAGALLRVLVQLAFLPAFIHSDAPRYLSVIDDVVPATDRPVGYTLLLLRPLSALTPDVVLVAAVQHALGMATAVVLYLLLRRWSVGRWVAALATVPVLFDALQLNLEHTVLSDTLFQLMLVTWIAVLCWRRRPPLGCALLAGLVLGASVTVRLVGEHLVLVAVLACLLLAGPGWRRRVATAVVLVVGFAVPAGAYAAWYHEERGVFALSEFTGRAIYLRSTSFVDCGQLTIPAYQRVLCPAEPLGQRRDPTYYVFHDTRTLPRLQPPEGTSQDEALRQFAFAAARAQPLDYAGIVARDFWLNFRTPREDAYEFDTADKWQFDTYLTVKPTAWTGPAYAAHGGSQLRVRQPFADAVVGYGHIGQLPGWLLLGCLLTGLLGALGVGRARRSGLRAVTWLLLLTGVGLLLAPAATAQFVWRYQLPALALLPAAAALGYTALRGGQAPGPGAEGPGDPLGTDGTDATARTD